MNDYMLGTTVLGADDVLAEIAARQKRAHRIGYAGALGGAALLGYAATAIWPAHKLTAGFFGALVGWALGGAVSEGMAK